jgi:hypothetical protein
VFKKLSFLKTSNYLRVLIETFILISVIKECDTHVLSQRHDFINARAVSFQQGQLIETLVFGLLRYSNKRCVELGRSNPGSALGKSLWSVGECYQVKRRGTGVTRCKLSVLERKLSILKYGSGNKALREGIQ